MRQFLKHLRAAKVSRLFRSARTNNQYARIEITAAAGRVYVGRVEEENDERLVLRTVAGPDFLISIEKRHIEQRVPSRISNMRLER